MRARNYERAFADRPEVLAASVEYVLEFVGAGVEEKGRVASVDEALFTRCVGCSPADLPAGRVLVEVDPRYFRPTEVDILVGDAGKARDKLGWKPKHSLEDLVSEMMAADVRVMKRQGA